MTADDELYLIDPVSKEIRRLTSNAVDDTFPTWSPGYERIAFTHEVDTGRRIFVSRADGSAAQELTTGVDDFFPAWSRDDRIAFVRRVSGRSSIRTIAPDGSSEAPVISGNVVRAPAWSADGTTLALFGDLFESDYDLATIHPDGSGLDRLTTDPALDLNPSWSPDGRTIVFVRDAGAPGSDDNDLYLFDVATKTVTERLTDNDVQDGNPVWSPDGTQIAFYRKSEGGFHIWLMNRDGTGEVDLMPDRPGRNLDPQWR